MTRVNAVEETASACCGGPAPGDACCVQDADAKAAGETGCGCDAPKVAQTSAPAVAAAACCGS